MQVAVTDYPTMGAIVAAEAIFRAKRGPQGLCPWGLFVRRTLPNLSAASQCIRSLVEIHELLNEVVCLLCGSGVFLCSIVAIEHAEMQGTAI